MHVAPQLMPAGDEVTVPLPVPPWATLNGCVKVAETAVAPFMVTVQVPVPVQAPLQPVNVAPLSGVAVSVTDVPAKMEPLHWAPQ